MAPPRLNGVRTGVFSTRSPHRPCPIGLSLVKITKIENNTIFFEGVDMVDQTPVLDIKPYIPHYDNPLHVEKLNTRLTNLETLPNGGGGGDSQINEPIRTNSSFPEDTDTNTLPQEESSEDVSQDEEIALRLQAQEFQDYGNFENDVPDSILQYLRPRPENVSRRVSSRNSENESSSRSSEVDTPERIRNINLESEEDNNRRGDDRAWRNSRLLEGADGPSTVCGTDLDLIRRRALNARLDNSPIRMGVREAPDGEEGFESQTLTPSQTVPNIQNVTRNNSDNVPATVVDVGAISTTEIRVPDWISRPQTSTLAVVFNERALAQLNEILDDKAEEEKIAIENVLREDPRSVYLRQRWGNQFYTFLIHDLHITCRFYDSRKLVTVFQVRHAGRTCECGEPEWQCLGHSPLN